MATRYRLLFDNTQGGTSHSNVTMVEIEIRSSNGGVDETTNTGGTASASGNIGAEVASKAIDDDTGTMWNCAFTAGSTWWEFEFDSDVTIVEYAITTRASYLNDSPTEWRFQSHNGTTWDTLVDETTGADWTSLETRTFYIGDPPASLPAQTPFVIIF